MICLSAGNPAGTTATAAERHYLDALKLAPERLVGIAASVRKQLSQIKGGRLARAGQRSCPEEWCS
ncbi:hypothetical protein [Bradyrhizobium sp. STM 3561]|uniref:hypothetical protein n=1 Tax=Bradyrhizobium sp. STM 3561 TaxID=578923 RepID=UPI00388E543F